MNSRKEEGKTMGSEQYVVFGNQKDFGTLENHSYYPKIKDHVHLVHVDEKTNSVHSELDDSVKRVLSENMCTIIAVDREGVMAVYNYFDDIFKRHRHYFSITYVHNFFDAAFYISQIEGFDLLEKGKNDVRQK